MPRRSTALLAAAAALVIVPASLVEASRLIPGAGPVPGMGEVAAWLKGFRIANAYHVFPTVPAQRIEIKIDASADGEAWTPVPFRYRPVALDQAPRFVVPHQPRLDWLMWFVPQNPLFLDLLERFLLRLLEGSAPVTALLQDAPAGGSPRRLRVEVYRYRFTTPAERQATGNWWHRQHLGPFYPLPMLGRGP
jgi:hypothetical protein